MELSESVYLSLRRVAQRYFDQERIGHTLQPTALVHEAFVRLSDSTFNDESHFRAAAAVVMRRILVDHARTRNAAKRGGGALRITLADGLAIDAPDVDLVALDEALTELATMSERRARVVELRFFGGLTAEEIGHELGVARKTAEADWYFARAWLRDKLAEDGDSGETGE